MALKKLSVLAVTLSVGCTSPQAEDTPPAPRKREIFADRKQLVAVGETPQFAGAADVNCANSVLVVAHQDDAVITGELRRWRPARRTGR